MVPGLFFYHAFAYWPSWSGQPPLYDERLETNRWPVPANRGVIAMRLGIAADHGGFALKEEVGASLRDSGYDAGLFSSQQI
jgi:hypothetical protein